jgi:hypothetical protein
MGVGRSGRTSRFPDQTNEELSHEESHNGNEERDERGQDTERRPASRAEKVGAKGAVSLPESLSSFWAETGG